MMVPHRSGDQHRTHHYSNTYVFAIPDPRSTSKDWAPLSSIKPNARPRDAASRGPVLTPTLHNGHARLPKPAQLRHRCHHRHAWILILCHLSTYVLDLPFPLISTVNPIRSNSDGVWWRKCHMVSVCYLSELLQCIPEGENEERARFRVVWWFIPGLDRRSSHDRFSLPSPTIATTWVCIGFHNDRGWKPLGRLSQGHGHGGIFRPIVSSICLSGPVGLGTVHSRIGRAAPRSLSIGHCIRQTSASQPLRLCSVRFAPSWENWNGPVLAAQSPRHVLDLDIQPRRVFQSGVAGSNSLHVLISSVWNYGNSGLQRLGRMKRHVMLSIVRFIPGLLSRWAVNIQVRDLFTIWNVCVAVIPMLFSISLLSLLYVINFRFLVGKVCVYFFEEQGETWPIWKVPHSERIDFAWNSRSISVTSIDVYLHIACCRLQEPINDTLYNLLSGTFWHEWENGNTVYTSLPMW